jgi:predicted nucleic acid-binding protein
LLEQIRECGVLSAAQPVDIKLPDPDDRPFMEVALSAGAECLVTGNRRHFPKPKGFPLNVLTPAEFIRYYQDT